MRQTSPLRPLEQIAFKNETVLTLSPSIKTQKPQNPLPCCGEKHFQDVQYCLRINRYRAVSVPKGIHHNAPEEKTLLPFRLRRAVRQQARFPPAAQGLALCVLKQAATRQLSACPRPDNGMYTAPNDIILYIPAPGVHCHSGRTALSGCQTRMNDANESVWT